VLGLNERIERSLLKIFLSVLGLILLLGAVGYFGSSAFRAWQVRRLLAEANALINEGDYKHASLNAQRVLELSPENADATRVIARSAESAGLRRAIEFWRRVNELSKNAKGDLSAWARCAVRFGDADSASKALDAMPAPAKETADYHALRGDVALIRHDLVGYEKELLEAKRRDPQDKKYIWHWQHSTLRLTTLRPTKLACANCSICLTINLFIGMPCTVWPTMRCVVIK
jgi:tetratricopeptide (TPR) repeat protein